MIRSQRQKCINAMTCIEYKLTYYNEFDYSQLNNVPYVRRSGRGDNSSYNDVIIMCDTETSKGKENLYDLKGCYMPQQNHVVAWTISIRTCNRNIVTLWGHKPSELCQTINSIIAAMPGQKTMMYWHNMSYDWTFIRKFMFVQFGHPTRQLNTKSHYPIMIEWENGLIFRDSLILAQRSLDKWAKDLNVEHQKAIGMWDYDIIRNQDVEFTLEELTYIEHDTLAGVECIQKTKDALNKFIFAMPYTATGIPREEMRNRGKEVHAHAAFKRIAPDYELQQMLENVYHGGYTHGNRHFLGVTVGTKEEPVRCYDFASSYPFCLLAYKYPSERFTSFDNCSIDYILRNSEKYAFMFKLVIIKPRLKDDKVAMPTLQYSKCVKTINAVTDNGRVLCAGYVEIYLNEIDLEVIASQYDYDFAVCTEVYVSMKDYLPRWFTDYVYQLFHEKTTLKGGDPVLYAIAKAKLNSLYGMCVQKPCKDNIEEEYMTGDYIEVELSEDERRLKYEKYINNNNSVLPYFYGVWCTSFAFRNLHKLGPCCGTWYYSDTDSCYGTNWNTKALDNYNNNCKELLKANGYGPVLFNNREYWLGIAEPDSIYYEYRYLGAKRYCGRSIEDDDLHITVAGVPKKGAACLNDDIENFTAGTIFSGSLTGKKTHYYLYADDINIDAHGNECADSIDLAECDYLLDSVDTVDWEKIFTDDIEIQVYDEERINEI